MVDTNTDERTVALIAQLLFEDRRAQEAADRRLAMLFSNQGVLGHVEERLHPSQGRVGEYVANDDTPRQANAAEPRKIQPLSMQKVQRSRTHITPESSVTAAKRPPPIVAESSTTASKRKGPKGPGSTEATADDGPHTCMACQDQFPITELVQASCSHEYCQDCSTALFTHAIKDQSMFPPKCCGQPITLESVRKFLTAELIDDFKRTKEERDTPNRTYCSNKTCSAFLKPIETRKPATLCVGCGAKFRKRCASPNCLGYPGTARIEVVQEDCPRCGRRYQAYCPNRACKDHGKLQEDTVRKDDNLTCSSCGTITCTICKGAAHYGDCPADTNLQRALETATENNWKRCKACGQIVERIDGCNHMICVCGAHFCYTCGAKWKTCRCSYWPDQPNLAAIEVDINDRLPFNREFPINHGPPINHRLPIHHEFPINREFPIDHGLPVNHPQLFQPRHRNPFLQEDGLLDQGGIEGLEQHMENARIRQALDPLFLVGARLDAEHRPPRLPRMVQTAQDHLDELLLRGVVAPDPIQQLREAERIEILRDYLNRPGIRLNDHIDREADDELLLNLLRNMPLQGRVFYGPL